MRVDGGDVGVAAPDRFAPGVVLRRGLPQFVLICAPPSHEQKKTRVKDGSSTTKIATNRTSSCMVQSNFIIIGLNYISGNQLETTLFP